jgi:hypothetical protein
MAQHITSSRSSSDAIHMHNDEGGGGGRTPYYTCLLPTNTPLQRSSTTSSRPCIVSCTCTRSQRLPAPQQATMSNILRMDGRSRGAKQGVINGYVR